MYNKIFLNLFRIFWNNLKLWYNCRRSLLLLSKFIQKIDVLWLGEPIPSFSIYLFQPCIFDCEALNP